MGLCYMHQDQADDWSPSDDDAPDAPPPAGKPGLRVVAPGERAPVRGPQPLELDEQPDEDWDPSLLPGPAERICREVQRTRGGPFALSASMAMGVLCTMVQGKVRFRITPTWTEEACCYWLVFTPPSAGKSSTVRPILKPLEELEAEIERNVKAEQHLAKAKQKGLEKLLAELGRRCAQQPERATPVAEELDENSDWNIPTAGTPQGTSEREAAIVARKLASLVVPEVPRITRHDINPTMLPKRLAANQRAEQATYGRLGILSSEPTFLRNIAGRHTRGTPMLETVLSAYDGDKVSEDRVGEHSGVLIDSTIQRPLLTVVCQGQPEVLDDLLAIPALRQLGFFSRCIIHSLRDTAPWTVNASPIDEHVAGEWTATIRNLHAWEPEGGTYELDLSWALPTINEMLEDARKRCAADPSQTARARRAIGKALRLVGMWQLFQLAPWSISGSPESPESPELFGGVSLRACVNILKRGYILLYPPVITGVRPQSQTGPRTDTHTETRTERASQILRRFRRSGDQFGLSKLWTVSQLSKLLSKPASWFAPALEELEEAGYIAHDPKSVRLYRGERAPRAYTTLSLGDAPKAPQPNPEDDGRVPSDIIGDDIT
jgi:hypothetical protein